MVPPNSKKMISFASVPLPDNCNFIFHPTIQANLILYTHIINYTTTKILVSNTSDCPLCIPQYQKLSHIVDICYENCLLADAQVTFDSAAFPLRTQLFFGLHAGIALAPTDMPLKTQLSNGMRVYRNEVAVKEISELMAQYPSI